MVAVMNGARRIFNRVFRGHDLGVRTVLQSHIKRCVHDIFVIENGYRHAARAVSEFVGDDAIPQLSRLFDSRPQLIDRTVYGVN